MNEMISWENGNGISAKEGQAFLTLDGNNYPIFNIESLEASVKKEKKEQKVVGKRSVGHKTIGWSGSGTLKIKQITSYFTSLFLDYVNDGRDVYFSVTVINEDESTPCGRETKVLTGCNFDETNIAQLNAEDIIGQELPFTFEGAELLSKFND